MNDRDVSWTKRFARLSSLTVILLLVLNLSAYAEPGGQSGERGKSAERSQANGANARSSSDVTTTSSSNSADHSNTANCDGDTGNNSDTGNGANSGTEYDNNCVGAQSGNGNGGGNATGRPCAGCVGQADDKNPKGQMPNAADDGNNGYECDGNSGIARTNPAHTGCAQTTTVTKVFGANATIGDLICGETSVAVTLNNTNNAAAGSRIFTVKLDGSTVSTRTLASGGSETITVSIPATGTHTVSVESTGMTTVTKPGLSQLDCTQRTFGANAQIGSLTCTTQAVAVTFNNTNNAAAGARSFTVKLDGAPVSTHQVASGASGSTSVSIPATGTHSVSVESAGMTPVTKSGLARQTCVLGERFTKEIETKVLGVRLTKVLGVPLARTGGSQGLMAVFALALMGLGLSLELGGRKKLVFNR